MALFLIVLVLIILAVLIWRPWGKASLFGGEVKVEYKNWEDGWGGAGKHVALHFNLDGEYRVTINSQTFTQKDIVIRQYEVTKSPMEVAIDINPFETKIVEITIKELKEDGRTETCQLYAF